MADVKGDVTKILCPFCSAPWTEDMVELWGWGGSCDTCDYGSGAEVKITCGSCNGLIYRKETD